MYVFMLKMYLKDIVANYLPNIKLNHDFLIIGVTGNVASGKSTFASYLKKELQKSNSFFHKTEIINWLSP